MARSSRSRGRGKGGGSTGPPTGPHRGRQVVRQWKILRALEAARLGLTKPQLKDVIEERCTERTLYRDLAQLHEAGFPIIKEGDRWRILGSGEGAWSIPIQPSQLLALTLSEDLMGPLEGSWLAAPLDELRATLSAILTPVGRAYLQELRRSAVATLFAPGEYRRHRAELEAIQEAIEKQQRLELRYAAPHKEPEARLVDPYSTWYAGGRVYLIAYCHSAGDIRTFAVSRIQSAVVTDDPFDPAPDFDPATYARTAFGVFGGTIYRFTIDFSPDIAHLVRERRYHHTQRVTSRPNGTVRLTFEAAGLPEVAAWVASFGGKVRAVRPRELVERVKEIHEGGLAVHGAPDKPRRGDSSNDDEGLRK